MFLWCWVLEVLYKFWILTSYQVYRWIYSPILWVVFLFCWSFSLLLKNIFVWCSLIYFFFCFPGLGRYIQYKELYEQHPRFCCLFLLWFLWIQFQCLTLWSILNLFVCGVKKWTICIFLEISLLFPQHLLLNKPSLAHCMCLLSFSNINCKCNLKYAYS